MGTSWHKLWDRVTAALFAASAVVAALAVLVIAGYLARQGFGVFTEVSPRAFFGGLRWSPPGQLGIVVLVAGTMASSLLALALGGGLGLAGAIFLARISPRWMDAVLRPAVNLLAGIPSVVYGWIGLTVFVPVFRRLGGGTGFSLGAAAVVLGVMILPTVLSLAEDALMAVPRELEDASRALGATRWQTIRGVTLPVASRGISTAFVLALARAIGEATAVQMVIGNTPEWPTSIFAPTDTITGEILTSMGNAPTGSAWSHALFMLAFLLLLLTIALIVAIRGRGGANIGR